MYIFNKYFHYHPHQFLFVGPLKSNKVVCWKGSKNFKFVCEKYHSEGLIKFASHATTVENSSWWMSLSCIYLMIWIKFVSSESCPVVDFMSLWFSPRFWKYTKYSWHNGYIISQWAHRRSDTYQVVPYHDLLSGHFWDCFNLSGVIV